jgi:hypothetical protein
MGKEAGFLHVCKRPLASIVLMPPSAAGPEGFQDVTRAYVNDWSGDCQQRRRARGWDENELASVSFILSLVQS